MTWSNYVLLIVINWGGSYILSGLYCLWLHRISRDIKFEGIIMWYKLPILRYRLISKNSWFAKLWEQWYGHSLLGFIIHKDKKGVKDDELVEEIIVHELRHVTQHLVLGLVFYIIYTLLSIIYGYENNWFEKDANRAVTKWIKDGRPKNINFGKRY